MSEERKEKKEQAQKEKPAIYPPEAKRTKREVNKNGTRKGNTK